MKQVRWVGLTIKKFLHLDVWIQIIVFAINELLTWSGEDDWLL